MELFDDASASSSDSIVTSVGCRIESNNGDFELWEELSGDIVDAGKGPTSVVSESILPLIIDSGGEIGREDGGSVSMGCGVREPLGGNSKASSGRASALSSRPWMSSRVALPIVEIVKESVHVWAIIRARNSSIEP